MEQTGTASERFLKGKFVSILNTTVKNEWCTFPSVCPKMFFKKERHFPAPAPPQKSQLLPLWKHDSSYFGWLLHLWDLLVSTSSTLTPPPPTNIECISRPPKRFLSILGALLFGEKLINSTSVGHGVAKSGGGVKRGISLEFLGSHKWTTSNSAWILLTLI